MVKFFKGLPYFFVSLILTIIVSVGSLLPSDDLPDEIDLFSDKLVHLVSYFALHFTWSLTYSKYKVHIFFLIAFLLLVYSGLIEILQDLYTADREADLFDILANGIGICISLVIFMWRRRTK